MSEDERPVTEYGRLINGIVTSDDPAERARMGQRLGVILEYEFGRGVDTAQAVRIETEEWLRQRVGETNDLISGLNQEQRSLKGEISGGFRDLHNFLIDFRTTQEAALQQARAEFQSGLNAVGESVSQLHGEVGAMRVVVDRQTQRMDQLEAGQAALVGQVDQQDQRHKGQIDRLTNELVETNRRLDESVDDRADLRKRIEELYTLMAGRPDLEQTRRLVGMIERHEQILNPSEQA